MLPDHLDSTHASLLAVDRFQNMFIEESEADGSCGIDFIFPYLRLTSNEDRTLVIGCLNTLQNLSRGNGTLALRPPQWTIT